jgi:hypothetical protein
VNAFLSIAILFEKTIHNHHCMMVQCRGGKKKKRKNVETTFRDNNRLHISNMNETRCSSSSTEVYIPLTNSLLVVYFMIRYSKSIDFYICSVILTFLCMDTEFTPSADPDDVSEY